MGKHYWKEILPKVMEMKEAGYTHKQIGEELGYNQEQIKQLVKRNRKKTEKAADSSKTARQAKEETTFNRR